MFAPKSRGFTLIELVVVITILGILAAFAVPRFVALESQARLASVQALAGSVRSAAALAKGAAMASGTNPSSISMEGSTINLVNGYPAATVANGIVDALADSTGFAPTVASGTLTFTRAGATTPASCVVTYAPPAAAGGSPAINVTTWGC
jgi:MSHA pilin protein MshA